MLAILREISVPCFFTSYVVVLVLELLRLWGRIPGRGLLVVVMTGLGLFTHICYMIFRAADGAGTEVGRLATWYDWSLLLALGLAICFFIFYLRRPDTIVSFFFLPAVILMIGLAIIVKDLEPFSRTEATQVWRTAHALSMMIGSIAVLFGFLAGSMYLVQSWRLKHKRAGSALRLPTLESLSRLNRQCLVISTSAVAIGLIAGVVMNLNRWGHIDWTDRGVLLSLLLLIWLVAATLMEFFYAPASHGRKAVYLTLASLGFLILAMVGVLTTPHGREVEALSVLPEGEVWLSPRQPRATSPTRRSCSFQVAVGERITNTLPLGESASEGRRRFRAQPSPGLRARPSRKREGVCAKRNVANNLKDARPASRRADADPRWLRLTKDQTS